MSQHYDSYRIFFVTVIVRDGREYMRHGVISSAFYIISITACTIFKCVTLLLQQLLEGKDDSALYA